MTKAITLDVDGTITDKSRELDIVAVKSIRKAEKAEIPICLATGNVLCFVQTTSVLLGTTGPLISENGGIIFNQKNGEEHILGDTEEVDKGITILKNEFDDIIYMDTFDKRRTDRTLERTFDAQEATEILQEHGLNLRAIDSGFAIHIENPDINKGKGLEKVASILECSPSEIAAIGDAENDIEMLEKAGVSYAPANASAEAKKSSTHVMDSPYGKGVREAINQILENVKN